MERNLSLFQELRTKADQFQEKGKAALLANKKFERELMEAKMLEVVNAVLRNELAIAYVERQELTSSNVKSQKTISILE